MKLRGISLALACLTLFACAAETFAHGGGRGYGPGYGPGRRHGGGGYGGGYRRGPGGGYRGGGPTAIRCSPEVKENTVTIAQQVLTEVAQSKEFETATQFQEFVQKTSELSNADEKLNAYLAIVGVDSKDADAVAQFIGARERAPYVANVEKNVGLTSSQADILVQKFSAAALAAINQ